MLKNVGLVAFLNLISRLLGFVSLSLIAKIIGAGQIADAFFVAFRIPNILRSLLAEGAFTSAFVPVLADDHKSGIKKVQETISSTIGILTIVGIIISALGIIFPDKIVNLIAAGFHQNQEQYKLCTDLVPITLPYIYFISLIALINACLNSINKYGASSYAQIVMNIVTIVGTIFASMYSINQAVYILAYFVLIGGMIQVIAQIPSFYKAGFKFFPISFKLTNSTKKLLKLMIPATLSSTVYQISIFLNTLLASLLVTGSISWLTYADRLSQIPIGLFTVSLGSVLLPTLSKLYHQGDYHEFNNQLNKSLNYSLIVIAPISLALFLFAEDYIALLFEYGSFTANDTMQSAKAVKAIAIGLIFATLSSMLSRAFLAKGDTKIPSIISIFSLLSGILLSIILMGTPKNSNSANITEIILLIQKVNILEIDLGHAALALASGFSALLSTILYLILAKTNQIIIYFKNFLLLLLKTILICLILSLIVHFNIYPNNILFRVILESLTLIFLFIILSYLFKVNEIRLIIKQIKIKFNFS